MCLLCTSCHPVLKIVFLAFISNHTFNNLPQFSIPRLLPSSPFDCNCHDTVDSNSVCWESPLFFWTQKHLHEPAPAQHQYYKLRPSVTFWIKLTDSLYRSCQAPSNSKVSLAAYSVHLLLYTIATDNLTCSMTKDPINCQSYWNLSYTLQNTYLK